MLKEFLDNVIAKDIHHKLDSVWPYFLEDLFLFVAVCGFQFVLYESRTMLITAELHDMVVDVL